ncbi:flagellar basal body P-ring formation chaperone FlgA [Bacteriovorax sp. BSW11_IV]|uniref:flagellar basal body P-ring formation chaperone FlgA n=1 Tax=Bacteriovorax sp. BSW11_IV TaxID=1353529 RepID=UPI0009DC432D|nr:flagellar basal body P-ring formation chaperone FlgA [Bacteriovorax sp. BSW11_IV]
MMIKYFFILFTFIASFKVLSCEMTLPDKIFFINDQKIETLPASLQTACDQSSTIDLVNSLKNSNGVIPGFHIARGASIENLKITNNKVQINSLNEFVKEKLNLAGDLFITDLKVTGIDGALTLTEDQNLNIKCYQCERPGTYALNIEINSPFGKATKWGQIHIQRQVQVVKVKDEIRAINTDLTPDMFEEALIFTDRPSDYLKSKNEVVFYKNNKHFPVGHAVKKYDIVPINLVQRGQQAKVVIQSSSLKLSGYGIPLRSGAKGQNIELRNPKSNRTFSATVIDFNKVLVEL